MKKTFSFIVLMLLLTSMLTLAFNIQPTRAETEQTPTGWYWPAGTGDTGGQLSFLNWNQKFGGWHLAQDFPLDQGLPVYAIADGEVVLSGTDVGGYGRGGTPGGALVARFETSAEEFFIALYGHIDNPHADGKVEAGQILGYTNDYDPPHLHFGIHPGYELPDNPWRGYTYNESETYGWVDPVQFLLDNNSARAIPEFPSFLILPLFILATLLALIVYKRKHCQTRKNRRHFYQSLVCALVRFMKPCNLKELTS